MTFYPGIDPATTEGQRIAGRLLSLTRRSRNQTGSGKLVRGRLEQG